MSESLLSGPERIQKFGDLFSLYQNTNESFRAEYGTLTAQKYLQLDWKTTDAEQAWIQALMLLAVFKNHPMLLQPSEVPSLPSGGGVDSDLIMQILGASQRLHGAASAMKSVVDKFLTAMGDDLEYLTHIDAAETRKKQARNTLIECFSKAVDSLMLREDREPHGLTDTVIWTIDGERRPVLLGLVALICAREWVEKNQALPTKSELGDYVMRQIIKESPEKPMSSVEWEGRWRKALKSAGLSSLQKAKAWSLSIVPREQSEDS